MRPFIAVPVVAAFLAMSTVRAGVAAAADLAPIDAVSASCKSGENAKCLEAGNRYRFGQGAKMDAALAADHYRLACKAGVYEYGCKALHQIGIGFLKGKDHRGRKATEDHGKAAEVFDYSCAGNYGPGCTSLGKAFLEGDGVAKNAIRANELFILGCEKGSRIGCRKAGDARAHADPAGARTFYEKGCRWKDSASCAALGRIHLEGAEVQKDAKRAFDYFRQSCNQAPGSNDSAGCFSLARMYDEGKGVEKSRAEAIRLYRQACTVLRPKEAGACLLLARAYREGDGIKSDANAAGQYFRQACELGSEEGCVAWHVDTCNRLGQPASCKLLEGKGVRKR